MRDSKKLSSKQRKIWFEYIKHHPKIFYAIASVSPRIVDRINISRAANLAASRAVASLVKKHSLKVRNCRIFLDGGLFLNSKFLILNSTTVVKGDEKISAVALASIMAKVTRDKRISAKHKDFPGYDFSSHKGYGTKRHFKEINKLGPTKIHRLTFLRKTFRYYAIA